MNYAERCPRDDLEELACEVLDELQENHPAIAGATSSRVSSGMGGAGAYVMYCVSFLWKSRLMMACLGGQNAPLSPGGAGGTAAAAGR